MTFSGAPKSARRPNCRVFCEHNLLPHYALASAASYIGAFVSLTRLSDRLSLSFSSECPFLITKRDSAYTTVLCIPAIADKQRNAMQRFALCNITGTLLLCLRLFNFLLIKCLYIYIYTYKNNNTFIHRCRAQTSNSSPNSYQLRSYKGATSIA